VNRPSRNLFDESETGTGMGDFSDVTELQPSTISNLKNIDEATLYTQDYSAVTVNDFAGQGLYGEYVVVFATTGNDAIDLTHVEDALLRFDYVSVSGGATPGLSLANQKEMP
jgi:hypothetical protein